jgi:uncharacterized protein with HEPN domain
MEFCSRSESPGASISCLQGTGNWLRHRYDGLDLETLWNTVQDDLPHRRSSGKVALARLATNEPPVSRDQDA